MSSDNTCGAVLRISGDFGDGESTFKCQLPIGHEGDHQEIFNQPDVDGKNPVTIRWPIDCRVECAKCGNLTTKDWHCESKHECSNWLCGSCFYDLSPKDGEGFVLCPACAERFKRENE